MLNTIELYDNIFTEVTEGESKHINYLVTKNGKRWCEIKEYIKWRYNLNIEGSYYDSTDDKGVVLCLTIRDKISPLNIVNIDDDIIIYSKTVYDYEGRSCGSYIVIQIEIDQQQEL